MVINIGDQFVRAAYYDHYKTMPIRMEIIKFCETIGFDYMGAIIWQKKITMNTTGGATIMGSYPYPRNGIVEIDYEFILIFKKQGKAPPVSKEIKEEFLPIIQEKFQQSKSTFFELPDLMIKKQNDQSINWKHEINKFEYRFKDPIKFDKKVDPNKLKFGSKINQHDNQNGVLRENYFTVKKIISPIKK